MADPPVIAAGRTVGGRYRLERRLGYGGMASVWLADDERLGRSVAVKVLSDTLTGDREYLERFRREAKVAAGLQHPNLVSVYDFGAGERPYLVMEYVPGGDLAERIERGEFPAPEQLAEQLLGALRHIHAAGVLHRDIKPQNVLVGDDGGARLTDFGIAQPRGATALTNTGKVLGTESFIAPEVMRGQPASERSDLYALGVLLADVARDGAGPAFWDLTDRLRDPDPELRPQSAERALDLLGDHGARPLSGTATQPFDLPPEEPPPAEPAIEPAQPDRPRRGRTLAATALVALVVAAAAAYAITSGGGDPAGSDQSTPPEQTQASNNTNDNGGGGAGNGSSGGGEAAAASAAEPETAPTEPVGATESPEPVSDDGVALNQQGYELVKAGSYDDAIPILERAHQALAGSGDVETYNYALYNLATAYLGAGRPDEAIPLLEERMQWNDGQLADVQAKLDEANAAAGVSPDEGGGTSSVSDDG